MPAPDRTRFLTTALALIVTIGPAVAQPPPADRGAVAATATSPAGSFSRRTTGDDRFAVVPADAELPTGALLVGLPGASLRATNDAVELTCRADFGGTSPLPILETAVTLHADPDADLAFTLDRGRVDLANRKLAGAATVRVRFRTQEWSIVLDRPGSRAAVETIGRWAPGTPLYRADPPPGHAPAASVVVLILAGTATVSDGKVTLAMNAPPGPAMVAWESTNPTPLAADRLDAVPAWADGTASADAGEQATAAAIEKFRGLRAADRLTAVAEFVNSADPVERRVGLIAAGAFDDLDRVIASRPHGRRHGHGRDRDQRPPALARPGGRAGHGPVPAPPRRPPPAGRSREHHLPAARPDARRPRPTGNLRGADRVPVE